MKEALVLIAVLTSIGKAALLLLSSPKQLNIVPKLAESSAELSLWNTPGASRTVLGKFAQNGHTQPVEIPAPVTDVPHSPPLLLLFDRS